MTVLSTTTRLLSILAIYINSLSDCFLVSNLRCTNVCLNLELTKQTVNNDLQMKLTHTSDDGLSSFLISVLTEGRILLSQLCKSLAHLLLSSLSLRLDSQLDNWLWELHRLKDYWMLLITDCITSSCDLETNSCCDISGVNLIKLHTLISVHLKNTAYTLLLILCSIVYIGTGVQSTGVNSEVS